MKVLNQQYVDKTSLMQQRYEEIILEMNTFKESLGKKIQVFEESKEDLLREVADLENIRKDKRTWISELEAREKNLESKQKELDGKIDAFEKEKSLFRQDKMTFDNERDAWDNEKKKISQI